MPYCRLFSQTFSVKRCVFLCLSFYFLLTTKVWGDANNTTFVVSSGSFSDPYYTITFESNGSVVDFDQYKLRKGNTYSFKANNISGSHPFNIGEAFGTTSPHATGGPLSQLTQGQSITVTIPSNYTSTLTYYCTAHTNMQKLFLLQ